MTNICVKALTKAIEIAGGQTALADLLNSYVHDKPPVTQSHIWNWLNRNKTIPPSYVIPVEKVVNGEFTRFQMKPDIYQCEP